ncbi:MAG: c-type cytochrome domain-containing protein [Pirellulaceae bacterium]|nr:c-type cytochrome domain-containing protein [Pirellulaceae bacterium]
MHVRPFSVGIAAICMISWTLPAGYGQPGPEASQVFREQIAPILASRCLTCHGDKQEGGYSVATPSQLFTAGDSDAKPIVANELAKSELWRRLVTEDQAERMPEDSAPLTKPQLAAFRSWIEAGAPIDASDQKRSIAAIAVARVIVAREHYPRPLPINVLAFNQPANSSENNPANATIWVGGYAELTQWQVVSGKLVDRLPVAGPQVSALAVVPDGKSLIVSSGLPGQRGVIERIALGESAGSRVTLEPTSDVAADLAVSRDGHRVAIGRQDGSLQLVELLSDQRFGQIESLTPHADAILALAWSLDGKSLITASRDRTAKLFKGTPIELVASYDRHERAVGGVGFLANRTLSLDETGRLRLMEGNDSDGIITEQSGLPRVLQRIANDAERVFIADRNRLREFRLETKTVDDGKDDEGKPKTKKVTKFREGSALTVDSREWITAVAITESTIAVGTQQGTITVWDRSSNTVVGSFLAKP